jgi:hypothetical protein
MGWSQGKPLRRPNNKVEGAPSLGDSSDRPNKLNSATVTKRGSKYVCLLDYDQIGAGPTFLGFQVRKESRIPAPGRSYSPFRKRSVMFLLLAFSA